MSGEPVLLDSVIVIDHLNGIGQATAYLREVAGRASISAITRAEVQSGIDPEHRAVASLRMLLGRFPLIPIDAAVADRAAELR